MAPSVNGTVCGRACFLPAFLPFIRAAGTTHSLLRISNSDHEASATSLRRSAVSINIRYTAW